MRLEFGWTANDVGLREGKRLSLNIRLHILPCLYMIHCSMSEQDLLNVIFIIFSRILSSPSFSKFVFLVLSYHMDIKSPKMCQCSSHSAWERKHVRIIDDIKESRWEWNSPTQWKGYLLVWKQGRFSLSCTAAHPNNNTLLFLVFKWSLPINFLRYFSHLQGG